MDLESRDMLLESATRFFAERSGKDVVNSVEKGQWPADLWAAIEEMGLTLVAVPEALNGVGGTYRDLLALMRVAGAHAVPVPLAETALASRLRAGAGDTPDTAPCTLLLGALTLHGERVSGTVARVPFASVARHFVAVIDTAQGARLAVIDAGAVHITPKPNDAGEPWGTVSLADAPCRFLGASPLTATRALELAALMRAAQMAGAAETVLTTAVEYSQQRMQFGRTISNFQAIQHMLSELASCVAAIIASAEAAALDVEEGGLEDGGAFSIACAKTQASEFAQRIAAIAHQSMGAMGFTQEHTLHHYPRRLWVWRRDFGSETFWGEKIGAAYAAAGPDAVWPLLSSSRYAR
jgi:acyl-CoA dehydrogenase